MTATSGRSGVRIPLRRGAHRTRHTTAIVVMGVAASGKTTVGRALARRLGWRFFDADDFHSPQSRAKMHAGRPLTDRDRRPWLERLNVALCEAAADETRVVLACSALTKLYRRILTAHLRGVRFVYLQITREAAQQRITARTHFFNPGLLANQFEVLEEPAAAITVDASRSVRHLVTEVAARVSARARIATMRRRDAKR